MRRCSKCETVKPLDQFIKRSKEKFGRGYWCKPCYNEYFRERYGKQHYENQKRRIANDRDGHNARRRKQRAMQRLRLSPEEYEALLVASNGRCAICRKKPKRSLCLDHDHKTGHVRGLLCDPCNRGLGYFLDNPLLMERAADYVRRNSHGQPASMVGK